MKKPTDPKDFLKKFLLLGSLFFPFLIFSQVVVSYSTPGANTFTVPAGVTTITVEAWGSGGDGGVASGILKFCGGGGGGAYVRSVMNVNPGEVYDLFVGDNSSSIANEHDTWFSSKAILLAKAGASVGYNVEFGAPGGSAAASIGDVTIDGANGGDGLNPDGGSGGDAGNTTGTGGTGAQLTATIAENGLSPGGGGGGGVSDELNNNHYHLTNGLGADGEVMITYNGSGTTGPDIDNDGVPDTNDLDNDNDGILDDIECGLNETSITISPSGSNPIDDTVTAEGGYPVSANADGNPGPSGTKPHPSSFNVTGTTGDNDSILGDTELSFTITLFDDGLTLTIDGVEVLYFDEAHYKNDPDFLFTGKFESNGGGGWTPHSAEGNPELLVSNGSIKLMLDTNVNDASGNPIREDALQYMDQTASGAAPFVWDETFTFDIFAAGGTDFIVSNTMGGNTSKFSGLIITASTYVCSDTDGDGISNIYDTDSDADTCADAMEGTSRVVVTDLDVDNSILGPVYSNGVPVLVGINGQDDVSSANDGILGSCGSETIYFDGVDDYITVDYDMAGYSEFTMMCWIKFTKLPAGQVWLMGQDNGFLRIDNAGKILAELKISGTQNTKVSAASQGNIVVDDIWSHVTLVYNANEEFIALYIDGVNETSQIQNIKKAGPIDITSSMFEIGGNSLGIADYYNGSMVEVKVYNRALTETEIREQVYQQVEEVNGKVYGVSVPKQIGTLSWSELELYLTLGETSTGGIQGGDASSYKKITDYENMTEMQDTNAPIPFTINGVGDWSDPNVWEHGAHWNRDKSIENVSGNYGWAIVELADRIDVTSGVDNLTLMGLTVPEQSSLTMEGSTAISNGMGTGQSLTVSDYFVLDGFVDLEGESQFFQDSLAINIYGVNGYMERDQQGTLDTYTYNYWSSPFSTNGSDYTLADIMPNVNFIAGYNGDDNTNSIAEYWIYKFVNALSGNYYGWQHTLSTGTINVGEGFTMKGPGSGVIDFYNYEFRGIPNNGDFYLDITAGNGYLIGNPYPSALDSDAFIYDNQDVLTDPLGGGGYLMFWEHWGGGSHYLKEYQGGYGYYSLGGGVPAVSHEDVSNLGSSKKLPQRYVPVGQGFFVTAGNDGQIEFHNHQREFQLEAVNESVFMKPTAGTAIKDNSENTDPRMKLRLGVDMPKGYHRQILVTADERATQGIDYGFEAKLADVQANDMFWMLKENKYVIQGLPLINRNTVIPIGFSMKNPGAMKIGIDELENVPEDLPIFIKELSTGITHEISETVDFELELEAGDYFDKYALVFQPKVKSLQELALIEGVNIRMNNDSKHLEVHRLVDTNIKTIEIFNFLGQRVGYWEPYNQLRYQELFFDNSSGVYIVKVDTENGQISKKVLVD